MVRIIKTPYFHMQRQKLEQNLEKLSQLEKITGVKILHTLKSFNHPEVLPLISNIISGTSVSSPKEIEMAKASKAKHLHLYAPAYAEDFLDSLEAAIDTLSFNSLGQWRRFASMPLQTSLGLRINPKLHLPIPSYCNPNLSYSRLGVDGQHFIESYQQNPKDFEKLEGLHLHALFQSSVEGLSLLLDYLYQNLDTVLPQLQWINLGGGHNFTDENYDIQRFKSLVKNFRENYPNITLYFEPGEAVVKKTGVFVSTVLDIVDNIVILDTSIETHLLDVAIVNQRLKVRETQSSNTPYYYQLAGNSCLQGDIIGEYFFKSALEIGDHVIFEDMMGYSLVKMTEFNGMKLANFLIS